MMSRALTAPALLAATIGVPYVASNAPAWTQQIRGGAHAVVQTAAPADASAGSAAGAVPAPTSAALTPLPQGPGATLFPTQTPLEGLPSYSIGDVLRMDVSKEWVYQRWPRKSTALSELDLFGVRVPLVTGTQLHDLAGSLTYYFGPDGRVKRISFRGRTGDTTQLAALVHQRFGLQAQPTPIAGEQLLQYCNGDDVLSELRTRPAPVLWASTPHDSFAVELELQEPTTARPLQSPLLNAPVAGTPAPTPAPGPVAGQAAPQPATVAATPPAPAADQAEPLGWKAFFPRSRLPKQQVQNLDVSNLYQ
jgi:hypothetical protein